MSSTRRTVHVAVFDTLADWEIGHLTAHLRNGQFQIEPGSFDVVTVGLTAAPVKTMGGLTVVPDVVLADLDPADSAMLVLPGGEHWESGELAEFVAAARRFVAAGVPVAAICGATFALAAAGLLDDRRHTSNDPGYLAASGYAGGAHYETALVVTDRDVISATAVAPAEFAAAVFARLGSHEPAVLDSWRKLYADRDPAGYFELTSA